MLAFLKLLPDLSAKPSLQQGDVNLELLLAPQVAVAIAALNTKALLFACLLGALITALILQVTGRSKDYVIVEMWDRIKALEQKPGE